MAKEKEILKEVCRSPIQVDLMRVVNHDEDGNEIITWESIDYPSIQRSLGRARDWKLDNLLKAGINPKFPIHTGNATRLEGLTTVEDWSAAADAILSENNNEVKNED